MQKKQMQTVAIMKCKKSKCRRQLLWNAKKANADGGYYEMQKKQMQTAAIMKCKKTNADVAIV